MARKKRSPPLYRRLTIWIGGRLYSAASIGRGVLRRFQNESPVLIVDGATNRHLRAALATAARTFAASLGAGLPEGLTIVVQRAVHDTRQVNARLHVFALPEGGKRYLVLLAQSVNGRQASEEEILVALRAALVPVLEDAIGTPVSSIAFDLELPRTRASAPIVELPANGNRPPVTNLERSSLPIERIENNSNHV